MASIVKIGRVTLAKLKFLRPSYSARLFSSSSSDNTEDGSIMEPPIPPYEEKVNEPEDQKRARLLYQSRKRGMSENGILLSTFAARYLDGLNAEQLQKYDRLINMPTNDWEIYYWMVGNKPTPTEFDHEVMDMLKEHAQNKNMEVRLRQPDLYSKH